MIKGIDVSKHQGIIDWSKVKKDGISFVIIRAGFGNSTSQVDSNFAQNIKGAKDNGIHCGAYWFSYAKDTNDALKEAKAFLNIVKGHIFEYPLCYDFEYEGYEYVKKNYNISLSREQISNNAIAFLKELEKNGYYAMNYANLDYINNYYNDSVKNRFDLWFARPDIKKPDLKCGMWQATFKGKVKGINTFVDINYAYKDYPNIFKTKGMNGFPKPV